MFFFKSWLYVQLLGATTAFYHDYLRRIIVTNFSIRPPFDKPSKFFPPSYTRVLSLKIKFFLYISTPKQSPCLKPQCPNERQLGAFNIKRNCGIIK